MSRKRRILIILVVATLMFIWTQSAMDPEKSSEESGFVMRIVAPVLELFLGKGNVTEHFVRKLAHFTEYAILGAEIILLMFDIRGSGAKTVALSGNFSLTAAVVDETIQIFSGRGSSLKDVWLDFAGAMFGIAISFFLKYRIMKSHSGDEPHPGQ